MVRIAISQAAFEAIARTLPLGGVAFENKIGAKVVSTAAMSLPDGRGRCSETSVRRHPAVD